VSQILNTSGFGTHIVRRICWHKGVHLKSELLHTGTESATTDRCAVCVVAQQCSSTNLFSLSWTEVQDFFFCITELSSVWTPVRLVFLRITAGTSFCHDTWYICVHVTQHNKNRRILGNPYQSGNNSLDFVNRPYSYYDHIIVQQKQFPGRVFLFHQRMHLIFVL